MTALNTTAYRIFRILQWLCEKPLSVPELNEKLLADPLVQRTLSEDSLWLYINTLKLLGCEITRPVPSNGFRHELCYHPFANPPIADEVQTLIRVKGLVEANLDFPEVLAFDRFVKRLVGISPPQSRDALIREVFAESRSLDYDDRSGMIEALRQAAHGKDLLFLSYRSPMQGKERFYLLPQKLFYERGALYLNGSRLGQEEGTTLRLDRIETFETTEQPLIREQLLKAAATPEEVVLHLYGITAREFEFFALGERVADLPEGIEVSLETRDYFTLKQKLLESGLSFRIFRPETFRAEMLETLLSMENSYRRPVHA